MNTRNWLHILSFFVLVCFSHAQERTDWDREFLHKGVKTLRIRGYHVKENGAVAQKGALITEMNIEKTFDAQGNLVREVFFDERNAETLRYEYTYSKQKVKKYKLHLDPKKEKVGLTVFNCDGSGNVTKEETYDGEGILQYSAFFVYDQAGRPTESSFLRDDFTAKFTSTYDRKGRLVEQEQNIADKGENVLNKAKYRYNSHGDCDRILLLLNRNLAQKKSFEYKYDGKGNWIGRFEYQDGKPMTIIERQIEYF